MRCWTFILITAKLTKRLQKILLAAENWIIHKLMALRCFQRAPERKSFYSWVMPWAFQQMGIPSACYSFFLSFFSPSDTAASENLCATRACVAGKQLINSHCQLTVRDRSREKEVEPEMSAVKHKSSPPCQMYRLFT